MIKKFQQLTLTGVVCATMILQGQAWRMRRDTVNGSKCNTKSCDRDPLTCEFELVAREMRVCQNCTQDSAQEIVTFNGKMPGPEIRVCHKDIVTVRVVNRLRSEGLSVHWHGMHQRSTPFMDGSAMVTQCPIPVNHNFTYKFLAEPLGTHWYHAQSGTQRSDGAYGTLIVMERGSERITSNYQNDSVVITVQDWLANGESYANRWTEHEKNHSSHIPDHILVNGLGTGSPYMPIDKEDHSGEHSDMNTTSNSTTPKLPVKRAEFEVLLEEWHRVRIINVGSLSCPVKFSVDYHVLEVVSADGLPVLPKNVTSVVLFPGERFDVILRRPDEKPAADMLMFLMHWQGLGDCRGIYEWSYLVYTETDGPKTETKPNLCRKAKLATNWTELVLNPFNSENSTNNLPIIELRRNTTDMLDRHNDHTEINRTYVELAFNKENHTMNHTETSHKNESMGDSHQQSTNQQADTGDNDTCDDMGVSLEKAVMEPDMHNRRPQMNNVTFKMPEKPLLQNPDQSHCNSSNLNVTCSNKHLLCQCLYVEELPVERVVEVVFVDRGDSPLYTYAMHMHGHHFEVVAMGRLDGNPSEDLVKNMIKQGNITMVEHGAVRKDVVAVPQGGYTIIRLYTDNPGLWYIRSHNLFHKLRGMAMLVKVGDFGLEQIPTCMPSCSGGQ